jgi:hypothetical protein
LTEAPIKGQDKKHTMLETNRLNDDTKKEQLGEKMMLKDMIQMDGGKEGDKINTNSEDTTGSVRQHYMIPKKKMMNEETSVELLLNLGKATASGVEKDESTTSNNDNDKNKKMNDCGKGNDNSHTSEIKKDEKSVQQQIISEQMKNRSSVIQDDNKEKEYHENISEDLYKKNISDKDDTVREKAKAFYDEEFGKSAISTPKKSIIDKRDQITENNKDDDSVRNDKTDVKTIYDSPPPFPQYKQILDNNDLISDKNSEKQIISNPPNRRICELPIEKSNDTGDVSSNKDDIAKGNEVGKQQTNNEKKDDNNIEDGGNNTMQCQNQQVIDDLNNKQDEKEKGTRGNEEKTPIIKNRVPRKEIDSLALGKTWKNEKLQIIDGKQRSTRKKMTNNQTQGE